MLELRSAQRGFWLVVVLAAAILSLMTWQTIAAGHGAATLADKTKPAPGPCSQVSPGQREACYKDSYAKFRQRREAWLAGFLQSGVDPGSLERIPSTANGIPPEPDLASAVKHAELIVVGSPSQVDFSKGSAEVTFVITDMIKGNVVGNSITISIGSEPVPGLGHDYSSTDYASALLTYVEGTPPIFPGEQAILFLKSSGQAGRYNVQGGSGHYTIERGRVQTQEVNPFHHTVEGQSEATFISNLRNLATP
jgi:hypothetical protein